MDESAMTRSFIFEKEDFFSIKLYNIIDKEGKIGIYTKHFYIFGSY